MRSLYIHVPFCDSICAYCDFCRVRKNEVLLKKWLLTLEEEINDRISNFNFDTVYIGGGTPTCLSEDDLAQFLNLIKPCLTNSVETTIEINPETLTIEKAKIIKLAGINRVSLGVQTIDETLLKLIGRKHTKKDIMQCIKWLHEVGITNISCDCMYSLPTQTMLQLEQTLDFIVAIGVPHCSIYSLTIEENSEFSRKGYRALDEDTEADMYEFIVGYLERNSFQQYEISNFCKKGYESKHNIHYWQYDDFVGLSIGASGKEEHCRYECTKNFEDYFKHNFIQEIIPLTQEDEMFEMIMMGLRLRWGLDLKQFEERFNQKFDDVYVNEKTSAINKGWLIEKDNFLMCTDKGYEICNSVIEEFMK
ncbi:radical SAM family heme chaperone HemW [Anaerorhabdus sp.]|uniref:radical SAM family heme chaperone HemW n=1 Tax=Anaerorhabdus sp. TaxID=1872524 RepID=UPI002FCB65CE